MSPDFENRVFRIGFCRAVVRLSAVKSSSSNGFASLSSFENKTDSGADWTFSKKAPFIQP
jgi:hypothetical protein